LPSWPGTALRQLWPPLSVALALQVLLTAGGRLFPDTHGLYGAPVPVGQSNPPNVFFSAGSSLFLPLWLLDLAVTALAVWALQTWLGGSLVRGLVAVVLALVLAFTVVAAHQLRLFGGESSELGVWAWGQLLVWAWSLGVLAVAWRTHFPR
jgi:hypothetical protein